MSFPGHDFRYKMHPFQDNYRALRPTVIVSESFHSNAGIIATSHYAHKGGQRYGQFLSFDHACLHVTLGHPINAQWTTDMETLKVIEVF